MEGEGEGSQINIDMVGDLKTSLALRLHAWSHFNLWSCYNGPLLPKIKRLVSATFKAVSKAVDMPEVPETKCETCFGGTAMIQYDF